MTAMGAKSAKLNTNVGGYNSIASGDQPVASAYWVTLLMTVGFWIFFSFPSVSCGQAATNTSEKVEHTNTSSYWDRVAQYWLNIFYDDVHPFLIKKYRDYHKTYGQKVSDIVWGTIEFWQPVIKERRESTYSYWHSRYPNALEDWARVPTPVKKFYESTILLVWSAMLEMESDTTKNIPETLRPAGQVALSAAQAIQKNDPQFSALNRRLGRLIEMARPHATDAEMRSCYKAVVIDLDFSNAFNTGCHIFVTKEMADELTDDELLAVLSHEMAHGDEGHAAKNFYYLGQSMGLHMARIMIEELDWLLTGYVSDYMHDVIKNGNMPLIIEAFGRHAPRQEIDADRAGVRILNQAGYSGEVMVRTLLKLHHVKPEDVEKAHDKIDSVRDYPSLNDRIKAVREASRY